MKKKRKKKTSGIETTFHVLANTRNDSAHEVLLETLESEHQPINEGALRALMTRKSPLGKRIILERWQNLSDRWKEIVAERPARMSSEIRHAVLGSDEQMCRNGCDAILYLHEYDLISALINAAEDDTNPNADLAARTLMSLAQLLFDELSSPRDYNNRRDPQRVRVHVVASLEASLERFEKHKRVEIIEAFLMLAKRTNSRLRKILQEPLSKMYMPVVETLSQSRRSGVYRLLLSFLDDTDSSSTAMKIISHRKDQKFLQHLTAKVGPDPSAALKVNLKRITSIPWMIKDPETFDLLDEDEQFAAVQMLVCSRVNRIERFKILEYLINHGNPGGRLAAITELAEFKGAEANKLTVSALEDPEPEVQAVALAQIRKRGIPGAMSILLDKVESPFEVVQEAARESLGEFSFSRFLAAFDMLEDDVRESTGLLVKKIDPTANEGLLEELKSNSRSRRIRAVLVTEAIGSAVDMEKPLVELLQDEDHMVRAAAARVLVGCNTTKARIALRDALMDNSVIVQAAAEQSLEILAEMPLPNDLVSEEVPGVAPELESGYPGDFSAEQGTTS